MTLDELQILISASAEDALVTMDTVIAKISELAEAAEGGGSNVQVALDTTRAEANVTRLNDSVKQSAAESAATVEAAAERMQAVVVTAAPVMQEALDLSVPAQEVADKLDDVGEAAQDAGKKLGDSFDMGKAAADTLQGTVKKLSVGIIQGLVAGGTTAITSFVITGIGSLISALINAKANAEAAAAALRKEHQEIADALEEERKGLDALAEEYETLAGKSGRTLDEEQQMYSIQQQLRNEYGITSGTVIGLAGSYDTLADAIRAAKEAQEAQSAEALATVANDTGGVAINATKDLYTKLAEKKSGLATNQGNLAKAEAAGDYATRDEIRDVVNTTLNEISDAETQLANAGDQYVAWVQAMMAKNAAEIRAAGGSWNDEIAAALVAAFQVDPSTFTNQEDLENFVYASANAILDALRGPEIDEAMNAAEAFHDKVTDGYVATEADYNEVSQSYDVLREKIASALSTLYGKTIDANSDDVKQILATLGIPEAVPDSWEKYQELVDQTNLEVAKSQIDDLAVSMSQLKDAMGDKSVLADSIQQWQAAADKYHNAAAGSRDAADALAQMQAVAESLGFTLSDSADNFDQVNEDIKGMASGLEPAISSLETQLEDLRLQYADLYQDDPEAASTLLGTINEIETALNDLYATAGGTAGWYGLAFGTDVTDAALSGDDARAALSTINDLHDAILDGYIPTQDDYAEVHDAYEQLRQIVADALRETGEEVDAGSDRVTEILADKVPLEAAAGNWEEFGRILVNNVSKSMDKAGKELESLQKQVARVTEVKKAVDEWGALRSEYDRIAKSGGDTSDVLNRMNAILSLLGIKTQATAGNLSDLDAMVAQAGDGADAAAQQLYTAVSNMLDNLTSLKNFLTSPFVMAAIDVSGPLKMLNGLISVAQKAKDLLAALGIKFKESDTYKPGGSKAPETSTVTEIADTESKYDNAIAKLEHLKAIGKATYDQELETLQKILAKAKQYNLSTEERLDLAERIYDVQTRIAARDADDLDTLAGGITDALKARYEAMEDAEIAALDTSRENWENWKDSTVAAIQTQIDALDDLTEAEDRESAKEEKLRKIASLQEQIAYEQDAYNHARLQQQLEAAQDSYNALVTKYDRQDQKAALEDAIDAVEAQYDAALDALDSQQEQIEALYDKRLETAALEAEAEKLLMNSTQREIIDLIAAYAPDYNATGESLGEQLYEGFLAKVGSIADWFESFNAQLEAAQANMAALTDRAADAVSRSQSAAAAAMSSTQSVYMTQQNSFNVPVESPSELARRQKAADEAMAEAILARL